MFLTAQELVELTHRVKGAWQARELEKLAIPYKRRSDGTLIVLRTAVETATSTVRREPRLRAG